MEYKIPATNLKMPIDLGQELVFILDCIKVKYRCKNRNDAMKHAIRIAADTDEIKNLLKVMDYDEYIKRIESERRKEKEE